MVQKHLIELLVITIIISVIVGGYFVDKSITGKDDKISYKCDYNTQSCIQVKGTGGDFSDSSSCLDNCMLTYNCENKKCTTVNGTTGQYKDLGSCQQACEKTSYNCDYDTQTCTKIQGTGGEFPDSSSCSTACVQTYDCDFNGQQPVCKKINGPDGKYNNSNCDDNCVVTYNCDYSNGIATCTPVNGPDGKYKTKQECADNCVITYNCDYNQNPPVCVTVNGPSGEHKTKQECDDNCIITYDCDWDSLKCKIINGPDGPYDSSESCDNDCVQRYNCDENTNTCTPVKGPKGDFKGLDNCKKGCGKTYNCDRTGDTPVCTAVDGSDGKYKSKRECDNDCVVTYNCDYTKNPPVCTVTEGPGGDYKSKEECSDNCVYTWSCTDPKTKQCVQIKGISGEHKTEEDCTDVCKITYNCTNEKCVSITGPSGSYSTLDDCESDCVKHYSCDKTYKCVHDPTSKDTLDECRVKCKEPNKKGYQCNDQYQCVPQDGGEYSTAKTCDLGCQPPKDTPNYGESACIQGIGGNVCFTPYQHILGSPALVAAKEKEVASGSDIGKGIKKIEDSGGKVWFATGSSGVANNAYPDKDTGGAHYNNGRCYQIRLNPDNVEGNENHLIMQSINTSLPNAFDVQLPAGGAGAFPDDGWGTCTYLWGTNLYGANVDGVCRAVNVQDGSICTDTKGGLSDDEIDKRCRDYFKGTDRNIFEDQQDAYESLIESCKNMVKYRTGCPADSNNHKGSSWQPVECPKELENVTGLRLTNPLPPKPVIADNNYGGLGTDIGKPLKWKTTDFGDNMVGKPETGNWPDDYGVQVSQMQDCRSPDSAQCFMYTRDTTFAPNYSSTYNVDANGKIINEQGRHGCHNLPFIGEYAVGTKGLQSPQPDPCGSKENYEPSDPGLSKPRLKGNFTNKIGDSFNRWQKPSMVKGGEIYTSGNCPVAFPPGSDECLRYQNGGNCSNMKDPGMGSNLEDVDFTTKDYWIGGSASSGGGGYYCYSNPMCIDNSQGTPKWNNACADSQTYCTNCFEGGSTGWPPGPEIQPHFILDATKKDKLSKDIMDPKSQNHVFCLDPSKKPPPPPPGAPPQTQCGQQTVMKGDGYEADEKGRTKPGSLDKCLVKNTQFFTDPFKCGQKDKPLIDWSEPTKYLCTTDKKCYIGPGGTFDTVDDCLKNCYDHDQTFTCNVKGECIAADPKDSGEYKNQYECINSGTCKPKLYKCDKSTYTCVESTDSDAQSYSKCFASCQPPPPPSNCPYNGNCYTYSEAAGKLILDTSLDSCDTPAGYCASCPLAYGGCDPSTSTPDDPCFDFKSIKNYPDNFADALSANNGSVSVMCPPREKNPAYNCDSGVCKLDYNGKYKDYNSCIKECGGGAGPAPAPAPSSSKNNWCNFNGANNCIVYGDDGKPTFGSACQTPADYCNICDLGAGSCVDQQSCYDWSKSLPAKFPDDFWKNGKPAVVQCPVKESISFSNMYVAVR